MSDNAPPVKPWNIPVEYAPCPHHPFIHLPVAKIRGEEHMCYLCTQLARKATYARQKSETQPTYEKARRDAESRSLASNGSPTA